jgi:uncharacterized membrane protein YphA (DoxX/SURF4 family)
VNATLAGIEQEPVASHGPSGFFCSPDLSRARLRAAQPSAMEFFHNNSAAEPEGGVTLQDFWLLSLRLLSGFVLIYFQGWHQMVQGWHFVWDKSAWPLVEGMSNVGIPASHISTPVFVSLFVIAAIGVLLGFLTRIMAAMGLFLCLTILLCNIAFSESLTIQSLILHCGLLLILTFAGGGRFSLGTLLSGKRQAI